MRPAGGFTPDMMNYALSTDVYQIWADMVTTNTRKKEIGGQNCCAYASRRNHVEYAHSHEDILNKYGSRIKMHEPVPEVLSGAMGNYMYLCFGEDDEAVKEFIKSCSNAGISTTASVVENYKGKHLDLKKCEEIATSLGAKFRVREWITNGY